MKRTKAPARKAPLKRSAPKPHRTRKKARTAAEKERWYVNAGACARCGRDHGLDPHHVIYEQHVEKHDGDIHDGRNQLLLCVSCHAWQHQEKRLPTLLVRDETITFARQLLGSGAAYEYLRRYYDPTDDPRVAALLAAWESGVS